MTGALSISPEELSALSLSLKVSFTAVLCSLPIAVLSGFWLARTHFTGKAVLEALVYLPLVIPPVVTGYILLLVMGKNGAVGGFLHDVFGISFSFKWTGAALACAIVGFPLFVRAVKLAVENIDTRTEQAASTLGASPVQVFFSITLPLMLPGILTGMMLCFARAMGEFGATITFVSNIAGQTRTLPLAIFSYTEVPGGDPMALRLTVISVLVSLAALAASEYFARKHKRRA